MNIPVPGGDVQELNPSPVPIADDELFVLNPLYRLRLSKHYILAQGAPGLGSQQLHRAVAIVLALCNGKHSVADIVQITRPLVKIADEAEAIRVTQRKVKAVISKWLTTPEETQEHLSEYPAATLLLSKSDYLRKFGPTPFQSVDYCVNDFLPKDPSEMQRATRRNLRLPAPGSIVWHFTSQCSTDCKYCYLGRRAVAPLPKERALALIDEAARLGTVELLPTGGDILVYKHLGEVLDKLCQHKFLPVILCTKTPLSKEKAKELADHRSVVTALQFSIDSTQQETADYLVGASNFWERISTSIENALEAGLRVEAKAVITPYNIFTIPRLYRDLKKKGVTLIRLATYCRSGFHHSDDLFNTIPSYKWLQQEVERLKQEFPQDYISIQNGAPCLEAPSQAEKIETWKERLSCSAGRNSMMICTDGKVIPCEQMPETEEYFCGDVSYQSIEEVWNGDRMRELTYGVPREKFRGQICYDCEEREYCVNVLGNCIRDLAVHYGGIYQPAPICPKYAGKYLRVV